VSHVGEMLSVEEEINVGVNSGLIEIK